jgi:hypothetical protein
VADDEQYPESNPLVTSPKPDGGKAARDAADKLTDKMAEERKKK